MESQSFSNSANSPLFQASSDAFVEPSNDNTTMILYVVILIGVIILVAHYAGFNVFGYLGKTTDSIGDAVFPVWERIGAWWAGIMEKIGGGSVAEGRELGKVAAKGAKKTASLVDEGADKVDDVLDGDDDGEEVQANDPESTVTGGKKSKNAESPASKASDVGEEDEEDIDIEIDETPLKKAINKSRQPTEKDLEKLDDISPNDVFSGAPRARPGNNKSGWCYIGSYSGYRSCSRVGEADKCMSGDIFPTHDVCVNPNLRA